MAGPTNYRNIADIKPNPKNPRVIKGEKYRQLMHSLATFPEMLDKRPLVCFTDIDGKLVVLGGNMRLKAATELGMKELPVTLADDWTEEQRAEFLIKDNVGFGEWNWEELQADWDVEKLGEWGLDIPQQFIVEPEATEDDYEIPDVIETDIVLGDLFEIGPHRLLCGDSTDSDAVAKLMNGSKADMVFTDPPYGMDKKEIKNDSFEFYPTIVKAVMDVFLLNCKDNATAFAFGLYPYLTEMHKQIKECNFNYIQDLYWLKGTARSVDNKFRSIIENIIYFSKTENYLFNSIQKPFQQFEYYLGEMSLDLYNNPQKATKQNKDRYSKGLISLPNLLHYKNGKGFVKENSVSHPTIKPIDLCGDMILQSSIDNDLVLDIFLGSGSTMVAAHQLNRKCYGMELDPKYCQVIIDRMRKLDPDLVIKKNGNAI